MTFLFYLQIYDFIYLVEKYLYYFEFRYAMAERERQGKISKIKGPKPNPHFEVHILKSLYVAGALSAF